MKRIVNQESGKWVELTMANINEYISEKDPSEDYLVMTKRLSAENYRKSSATWRGIVMGLCDRDNPIQYKISLKPKTEDSTDAKNRLYGEFVKDADSPINSQFFKTGFDAAVKWFSETSEA